MKQIIQVTDTQACRDILHDKSFQVLDMVDNFSKLAQATGADLSALIKMCRKMLFFLNGEDHRQLRQSIAPFFRPAQINKREPSISVIVSQVIDQLPTDRPIDLIETFAAPISSLSICHLLGLPEERYAQYNAWADQILTILKRMQPLSRLLRIQTLCEQFAAEIEQSIATASESNPDSFIHFCFQQTSPPFTPEDTKWLTLALFVAGRSPQHTLGNALNVVLNVPTEQRRQLLEPERGDQLMSLILKDEGSLQYLCRIASQAGTVGDTALKPGDNVEAWIATANQAEPPTGCPFSSGRNTVPPRHLSFGSGVHRCIAEDLGKLIIKQALQQLIQRYPQTRLLADHSPKIDSREIKSPEFILAQLS